MYPRQRERAHQRAGGKVDADVTEWHLEREVRNEQPKSVGFYSA